MSVIAPALNCVGDVDGFAQAMRAQNYPADRFEVIVVDNGSNDGTYEKACGAGFITLQKRVRGRTRALNAGLEAARGVYILSTDLSCRAEPSWIQQIVSTFEHYPQTGCVAGEIRLLKNSPNWIIDFQARVDYMSPMHALNRNQLPYLPFADGANASFRRELFDLIGNFDETFLKAGDVEICYRMLILSSYGLIFNPSALVWEPGEPSLHALLHQRFRMGLGRNMLSDKYPDLFLAAKESPSIKRLWRGFWSNARSFVGALRSMGQAISGSRQNRVEVIDMTLQTLMKMAQRIGVIYSRYWLTRNKISPIPVDPSRVATFVADFDHRIRRVIFIPNSPSEDPLAPSEHRRNTKA